MESLLEAVRAATANGASTEQKAAGVQACRTILAALDTEPGTPIVLPGMQAASQPAARLSLDQVLDTCADDVGITAARVDDVDKAHVLIRISAGELRPRQWLGLVGLASFGSIHAFIIPCR